jgi:hypothetical protein
MEEKEVFDKVVCTGCGDDFLRKSYGNSPNGRRKYYFDDKKNAPKGKRCPKCVRKAHREYMRQYRSSKKDLAQAI